MEIAPPTNATLSHIADVILESDSICICGHVNPDGDCIGSALALSNALHAIGKRAVVLLANDDELHPSIGALPGADGMVVADRFEDEVDLFISVDVSNDERIGESVSAVKSRAKRSITVDHHQVDHSSSDLVYIAPFAPSTTMIVWDLVHELGIEPSSDVAECAFFGLMTDTGGFRHANSSAEAFEYAASMVRAGANPNKLSDSFFQRRSLPSVELERVTIENMEIFCDGSAAISYVTRADLDEVGAVKSDCDPLIDVLRSIDGVKVCCMLKCLDGSVRGSLRSKDDIDVNSIARKLGGGGHRLASGFTIDGPLDEAIVRVKALIEDVLN